MSWVNFKDATESESGRAAFMNSQSDATAKNLFEQMRKKSDKAEEKAKEIALDTGIPEN